MEVVLPGYAVPTSVVLGWGRGASWHYSSPAKLCIRVGNSIKPIGLSGIRGQRVTALSMVGTERRRPLPTGDQSDRTRVGVDGSGDLQANPLDVCSPAHGSHREELTKFRFFPQGKNTHFQGLFKDTFQHYLKYHVVLP